MKKGILFSIILLALCNTTTFAQSEESNDVLFFIEDDSVTVSEFRYIYEKNNRDSIRNTRESLADYLQLYIKFKLKVQAARDMGLDTVKALQDELAMYRKQLAKNYLLDKEVEEAIARTVYERKQTDVHFSHILIGVGQNADTVKAYQKAKLLIDSLKNYDVTFEEIAKRHSDDRSVEKNGGDLGYLTAMFPPGFNNLEKMVYNMEEGEIDGPVRSKAGYHILKLHDKRPARGTVEIAHILVRKPKVDNDAQVAMKQDKIRDAYRALENGESWESVVQKYSEDQESKRQNGKIGKFRIGVYEHALEEAAFALKENGEYSTPVESSVGWHILKRLDRNRPSDHAFKDVRKELLAELEETQRLERARQALIDKIKTKASFRLHKEVYESFKKEYLKDLTNYKWQAPDIDTPKVLLEFGDELVKTDRDFIHYLKRNTRDRLRLDRKVSDEEAADQLLESFIDQSAIEYEQASLEEKYPDFRNLMREYREGILLFEVTKEKIWDRAPRDTVGLREFFEANKKDYMWNERAKVLSFTVHAENEKQFEKIKRMIARKPVAKVIKKYNKDTTLVTYESNTFEQGKKDVSSIPWEKDAIYDVEKVDGSYTLKYVQEILPAQPKTLQEAKGFVISDYQNHLEKEWIKSLQEKYRVKVVEHEFDELLESYQ